MSKKTIRIISTTLLVFLFVFYALPNMINEREERAFSSDVRVANAKIHYNINDVNNSVYTVLSKFYDRGPIVKFLFGNHYRPMWNSTIEIPVLDFDTAKGGLQFLEMGGGQQTISAEFKGAKGQTYTIRSVNKDQSKALHPIFYYSFLRPMIRDQASALNPFASLITQEFEKKAGILHTKPKLYLIPYDTTMAESPLYHIAGRVMTLEEEPDSTWNGAPEFGSPLSIISSEEMEDGLAKRQLKVDSLEYLKCRLLDFLISDWDRHGGQWKWAVFNNDDVNVCRPIAMDRDMAFYKFNDGLLNRVVLLFNNKFQSFTNDYGEVSGLIKNSREIDALILKNVPKETFLDTANQLQEIMDESVIEDAFDQYPEAIKKLYKKKHVKIFKQRLSTLDTAADEFYHLLH